MRKYQDIYIYISKSIIRRISIRISNKNLKLMSNRSYISHSSSHEYRYSNGDDEMSL
jgi:hypothetical protein